MLAAKSIATVVATRRTSDAVGPLLPFVTAVKLVSVCTPPSSYTDWTHGTGDVCHLLKHYIGDASWSTNWCWGSPGLRIERGSHTF